MPNKELFTGTILFADNKINVLQVTTAGRTLSEIEQIIKARNILNAHLEAYERNDKDRRK